MYDFSNLNSVKKKVTEIDNKRNDNFDKSYNEALRLLNEFKKKPSTDTSILKKTAEYLINAMEQKRTRPEPYILLASIFYMTRDDKLAIKYLKIASSIDPNSSDVIKLRKLLSSISISDSNKKGTGELKINYDNNVNNKLTTLFNSNQSKIVTPIKSLRKK